MMLIESLTRGRQAVLSTLQLWLIFLACAVTATLLIAALQWLEFAHTPGPTPRTLADASPSPDRPAMAPGTHRPVLPRLEFAPTFADAVAALRGGRFADAYGRFVTLANEGDMDAGRIALLMHRYGPEVFGSTWDATTEQLVQWTRWSEAAAQKELASRSSGSMSCGPVERY
jgi:hypothetical protein